MNVQEIKEALSHVPNITIGEDKFTFKIPFDLIQDAVYSVKDKSNMDIGTLDYCSIYFYQIAEGCKVLLKHLDLELDYEVDENGNAVNSEEVFEMYREIYEFIDDMDMSVFMLYENILRSEKALAEKEYVSIGQFEGKILNLLEKATTQIEKISDVATDKKKLKPLLAEFTKAFKGLDISGLKDVKESKEVKEK